MKKPFPVPVRVRYSCDKCPAYCCTYSDIEVGTRDIDRLAKHFDLTFAKAEARFTKMDSEGKVKILRHKKDTIFDSSCMFLDSEKRRCTGSDGLGRSVGCTRRVGDALSWLVGCACREAGGVAPHSGGSGGSGERCAGDRLGRLLGARARGGADGLGGLVGRS